MVRAVRGLNVTLVCRLQHHSYIRAGCWKKPAVSVILLGKQELSQRELGFYPYMPLICHKRCCLTTINCKKTPAPQKNNNNNNKNKAKKPKPKQKQIHSFFSFASTPGVEFLFNKKQLFCKAKKFSEKSGIV